MKHLGNNTHFMRRTWCICCILCSMFHQACKAARSRIHAGREIGEEIGFTAVSLQLLSVTACAHSLSVCCSVCVVIVLCLPKDACNLEDINRQH